MDTAGWTDLISSYFDSPDDPGIDLLQLAGLVVLIWLIRWLVIRLLAQRLKEPRAVYWVRKVSSYFATGLTLFVISQTMLGGVGDLLTFLGLVTAGLAIALRDPVSNMFGWLFIIWRRPFELGHRVQIGDAVGDVLDIRLFQTSLLEIRRWVGSDQPTGRIVHLPNSLVFTEAQYNYSVGIPFIWDEIPIMLTFESDWQKAKQILGGVLAQCVPPEDRVTEEDLRRMAQTYRTSDFGIDPVVITSVVDSGVVLTLRYTVRPFDRRALAEQVWEVVLTEFAMHPDIEFAYPTTRFYDHLREGPIVPSGSRGRTETR